MELSRLLEPVDLTGVPWVWLPGLEGPNAYAWFVRDVELEAAALRAPLAISADTGYQLWINEEFVLSGPMREVPPYFYYDALDIAPLLRPGRNRLRVLVHYQGVECNYYVPGPAGLLVAGHIDTAAGRIDLTPPQGWLAAEAKEYARTAHRLGGPLGYAEQYDVSLRQDWRGKFDGRPVGVVGLHPLPQRPQALLRDLPFFDGSTFRAKFQRCEGGTLADFGREVFGRVELEFRVARPARFFLGYAEQLTDGRVNHRKSGLDYRDEILAPPGVHRWESFEKRALRYAWIDSPEVEVLGLSVREYGYPYPETYWRPDEKGAAGDLKRRIADISARTIRICSDDLLNDCPWRERSQYLDPYAYFAAMQRLWGTLEPVKKYLRQFARGSSGRTLLPMRYPSAPGTTVIPDFVMTYALALQKYADLSGDLETVALCYDAAAAALRQLAAHEDNEGLLKDVPGWIYLDNCFELCRTGRSAGLNALYSGAHAALSDIAARLGKTEEALRFRERAQSLRPAFRKTFVRDGNVLDSDNLPSFQPLQYWNYHYTADQGRRDGGSFVLKARVRLSSSRRHVWRLSFFEGCCAWLDGRKVFEGCNGGSYDRPPLFAPQTLEFDAAAGEHELILEVENSWIDWEVFLAGETGDPVIFDSAEVAVAEQFGAFLPGEESRYSWRPARLRPFALPARTQVTIGLSALFGLLEEDEARTMLRSCLPSAYYVNYRKRTTPFFCRETEAPSLLKGNVLPCNTPWSLYFFCQALRTHGMADEAQSLLLEVYGQELELGATSWWEEWADQSSLCHGWGAFVAEFL